MVNRGKNIGRFFFLIKHYLELHASLFLSPSEYAGELPSNEDLKFEKNAPKCFRFVFTLILALLLSFFLEQNAHAAWYNSSWLYRQKITISSSLTDSNQANFPYAVIITDSANPIFTKALANGNDIQFTESDGTTLMDFEIELFDNSVGNEELAAWVRLPSLSTTEYTLLTWRSSNYAA